MKTKEQIAILIADDHPVFRKGLRDILMEENDLRVVGEVGDGDRVVGLVAELKPDILLLDLNLPGVNGLDLAAQLHDNQPPVKIIVLTMHREEGIFNKAMDLGVRGFVLKESAVQDIIESIRTVNDGKYYISPHISQYLVERDVRAGSFIQDHPAIDGLSPTERRILKLIAENKTSKDIADQFYVSIRTVENHRMNICNKLGIHGANALLKFSIENKSFL